MTEKKNGAYHFFIFAVLTFGWLCQSLIRSFPESVFPEFAVNWLCNLTICDTSTAMQWRFSVVGMQSTAAGTLPSSMVSRYGG